MSTPKKVLLKKGLDIFLQKRGLVKQFHKSKQLLLNGYFTQIDFRIRQPKEDCVYYFKINKQYRARGWYEGETFFIFTIDDHQN